jgi:hypothetical protein
LAPDAAVRQARVVCWSRRLWGSWRRGRASWPARAGRKVVEDRRRVGQGGPRARRAARRRPGRMRCSRRCRAAPISGALAEDQLHRWLPEGDVRGGRWSRAGPGFWSRRG